MGIALTPERKLAKKLTERHSLFPPIDIQSLVRMYARLTVTHIPFKGVDGISLNLKTPGRDTHVIVNEHSSASRQRFTMAHEMGHIMIPWHVGTVVTDHVEFDRSRPPRNWTIEGWNMEHEANSFAAELLMPHWWIERIISVTDDLSRAHKSVVEECGVSALSAAIRLCEFLPESIIYASEMNGRVEFSGRTEGTIASSLDRDTEVSGDVFSYREQHFVSKVNGRKLHWWILPSELHIDTSDGRSWRDILDEILCDVCDSDEAMRHQKMSVNGAIGYAYSKCRDKSSVDAIASACFQRLRDRRIYHSVVGHEAFSAFVRKRAEDLSVRSRQ